MQRVACGIISVLAVLLVGCTQQHLAPVTSVRALDEQPAQQTSALNHHAPLMVQETSAPPEHLRKPPSVESSKEASSPQPDNTSAPDTMPIVPVPEQYTVQPGDTLGGIAHHYGLSYIYLAKLNQLTPPYVIHIGQVLKMKGKIPTPAVPVKNASTLSAASASMLAADNTVAPILKPTPLSSKTNTIDDVTWSWPAQGKVQNQFQAQGDVFHQGIDIISNGSHQVHAAAQGKVVFSGHGAKGYGEMIILQHPNHYLSAYSHLSDIQVKEGEQVQRGQQIANMGAVNGQVQIHFEVRYHGQPVNPLKYLPKE